MTALALCWFSATAGAATYYIATAPSGNDSYAGSSASPWATTGKAFSVMAGGDTLIVRNGTYNDRIYNPPSGTPGAYTIIKAENDGQAIFTSNTAQTMLDLRGRSYVRIEGFKFEQNAVDGTANCVNIDAGSHHNKIMRCGFVKTPTTTNNNTACVSNSGSYNLFEECWAWGGGRYKFLCYGADALENQGNVYRRCVARHDREWTQGIGPSAGFCNYQASNTTYQNCIVLDSDFPSWREYGSSWDAEPYYDRWNGAWFFEKGQKGGFIRMNGCIGLHFSEAFVFDSPSMDNSNPYYTAGDLSFTNCVAIDGYRGIPITQDRPRTVRVDHCLFTQMSGRYFAGNDIHGWGFVGGPVAAPQASATNSIFYNLTYSNGGAILRALGANDYNCFYNNTVNRSNSTAGAHDITAINPAAVSLKYPVRIEPGSPLKGAGSGGTDIGPDIMKKIGVSGTLYGETGYDTVTNESLWPFPNEARIRNDMRSYPSNWPAGNLPSPTRGFCADGMTLTRYIWESLGNTVPSQMTADISGQVTRAGGAVLSGVTLTLSGGASAVRTTGADGLFSFTGLGISVPYTVTPVRSGYVFNPVSRSTGSLSASLAWSFTGSESAVPTYRISGTVRDSSGRALSGASLSITGNLSGTAITDDSGAYAFPSLNAGGSYTVTAGKEGYSFQTVSRSTASLNVSVSNWDFTGTPRPGATGPDIPVVPGAPDAWAPAAGEVRIIGSPSGKGTINPDRGDKAEIRFKSAVAGKFECRIFTLSGEQVWSVTMENVDEGTFEWFPKGMSSGVYVVYVKGPGINVRKKIAVIR